MSDLTPAFCPCPLLENAARWKHQWKNDGRIVQLASNGPARRRYATENCPYATFHATRRHLLRRLIPDAFTIALMLAMLAATFWPASGAAAHVLGHITTVAIGLLFFLHGAKLSPEAVRQDLPIGACTCWCWHAPSFCSHCWDCCSSRWR